MTPEQIERHVDGRGRARPPAQFAHREGVLRYFALAGRLRGHRRGGAAAVGARRGGGAVRSRRTGFEAGR